MEESDNRFPHAGAPSHVQDEAMPVAGRAGSDQHARFLETARGLGCDEDEAAFDEKLKAVVGPKVTDTEPAASRSSQVAPTK